MSDDELLQVVARLLNEKEEPVVATKDIAAHVDMGERGVRNRLKDLSNSNRLNRSVIGNRAVAVYWLPEDSSAN